MLNIYICDDVKEELHNIEQLTSDLTLLKDWDIQIAEVFSSPVQLLSALTPEKIPGLYLLDIELHAELDGLQLAAKIREKDPSGFIVFITSHEEYIGETFKYQLEALDFIIKSPCVSLKDSLSSVLNTAYTRYQTKTLHTPNTIAFKSGQYLRFFPSQDIVYIESLARTHQTRLHTCTGQFSGYEPMKELAKRLDHTFVFCHRSYIVNIRHIVSIDTAHRTLLLDSGAILPISLRKLTPLLKCLETGTKDLQR